MNKNWFMKFSSMDENFMKASKDFEVRIKWFQSPSGCPLSSEDLKVVNIFINFFKFTQDRPVSGTEPKICHEVKIVQKVTKMILSTVLSSTSSLNFWKILLTAIIVHKSSNKQMQINNKKTYFVLCK